MNTNDSGGGIKSTILPLYQSGGWMKFLGLLMIAQGVITAITIVGLVVAWLPIWLGVLLWQAANCASEAYLTDNAAALAKSLGKLKMVFIIFGVLMIVVLAILLLSWGSVGLLLATL